MVLYFMMRKERIEKIKKYIKDDRPKKLRSYVRKHKIVLEDIVLKRERNLLHYCCRQRSAAVFRYLLAENVDPARGDNSGNLPLHVALTTAVNKYLTGQHETAQQYYREMILPLIEKFPQQLQIRNDDELSAQEILNRLVAMFQSSSDSTTQSWGEEEAEKEDDDCHGNRNETTWREKLSEEMQYEASESWGEPFDEDFRDTGSHRESYDDWADRIYEQRRANQQEDKRKWRRKMSQDSPESEQSSSKYTKRRKTEEPRKENLEDIRAKMRKKFEEKHMKEKENNTKRKKERYENQYEKVQRTGHESDGQLTFDDIPWPSSKGVDESITVLFCDLSKDSKEYKKYLREQQIRWHPDKFSQRFGASLCEEDKIKVLERVTLLSQALNKLSE